MQVIISEDEWEELLRYRKEGGDPRLLRNTLNTMIHKCLDAFEQTGVKLPAEKIPELKKSLAAIVPGERYHWSQP